MVNIFQKVKVKASLIADYILEDILDNDTPDIDIGINNGDQAKMIFYTIHFQETFTSEKVDIYIFSDIHAQILLCSDSVGPYANMFS